MAKNSENKEWKLVGKFSDGEEIVATGNTENSCIQQLLNIDRYKSHGNLLIYEGVTDNEYLNGFRRIG